MTTTFGRRVILSFAAIVFVAVQCVSAEDPPAPADVPEITGEGSAAQRLRVRSDFVAINEPLRDVLQRLAAEHRLRVWFDESATRAAGAALKDRLNFTLRNFPFGRMVDRILQGRGLYSAIEDDVLVVTATPPAAPDRIRDRQGVVLLEAAADEQGVVRQRVTDTTLDRWIFGPAGSGEATRAALDRLLTRRIGLVDLRCGLTDAQKRKLQLAGRGDIKRLLDRIDQIRPEFTEVKEDATRRDAFFVEKIVPFESVLHTGPFDGNSLYAKTLATSLTPEQSARRAPWTLAGYKGLQKVGLALQAYHSRFGQLPAATMKGPDGKTAYSWRVELLPMLLHYVDREPGGEHLLQGRSTRDELREAWWKRIEELGYRLDRAWDDPANSEFRRRHSKHFRHPADAGDSERSAFFVVSGVETAFPPESGIEFKAIEDGQGATLMVVEARRDISWAQPEDIPYAPERPLPAVGGFRDGLFLALTCDGCVHPIVTSTAEGEIRALLTRRGMDLVSIPGIPWRSEIPREVAKPAKGSFESPHASPDRIAPGILHVGAIADASVRIFIKGDDVQGLVAKTKAPEFVQIKETKLATQAYGERGTFIVCDVIVSFETTRAGHFEGEIQVKVGDDQVDVPVDVDVLPAADGSTRLLVAGTPFDRFSTDDASLFDRWRELVRSAKLDASYLGVDRDRPVLGDLDLSKFDVILMGPDGVFWSRDEDLDKLKAFVIAGGRVIVTANHFFQGTVEKANKFVVQFGLKMTDVESREFDLFVIGQDEITRDPLTKGVRSLKFHRPSPVELTDADATTARLLVAAPSFPNAGLVAVAESGKGQVIVLGTSLWWNWIASEQESGADNALLLENLIRSR